MFRCTGNCHVDMVIGNNAIKLREIRDRVLADNITFANVNKVSITTIARVLERHKIRMKQLYTVTFEQNSERVKELRYQYVQMLNDKKVRNPVLTPEIPKYPEHNADKRYTRYI
ncbi:hypothetical protein F2P81_023403 [Scophthalmus maximus]|uniref:Uncharacterized protein n=1 Tax=Scophthalmus maximus TaxID=52904 RepID=A0A6A4S079_SCOMX|nr:hypothetical protein F2P81_023403 [Scophthalmus maximus]